MELNSTGKRDVMLLAYSLVFTDYIYRLLHIQIT